MALAHDADAVVCSYECTFCRACGELPERVARVLIDERASA